MKLSRQNMLPHRTYKYLVTFLLFCSACSPGVIKDQPQLYGSTMEASLTKIAGIKLLGEDLAGFDAAITIEGALAGTGNLPLHAVYRVHGNTTRFVLFMPQGTKLGQCLGNERGLTCQNIPIYGLTSLVHEVFTALDEARKMNIPQDAVSELVYGDQTAKIADDNIVLRHRYNKEHKTWTVINSINGDPLAYYMYEAREYIWKIIFIDAHNLIFYSNTAFSPMNIRITRYLPQK